MANFPKTDYASARRQVHEQAWQAYLKSQQPIDSSAAKPSSRVKKALSKLIASV